MTYLKSPRDILRNARWRLNCSISQEPIVFVLGAPRSGTTLLQRVLTLHDQLFSIQGETGLFSRQNIFARKHFHLSWDETRTLFEQSSDIVDLLQNGVCRLRKLQQLSSDTRMVEKTPQHVLQLKFLTRHFPNARFLHIIRDGRDCYCSSLNHPNIRQETSVRRFARYWAACVHTGLAFDSHPNVTRLTYEEFVESPHAVLSRIMLALGLSPQEKQLDTYAIGLDVRSERQEFARLSQPIQTTSVGRWKEELTTAEVQTFNLYAGKVLAELGYPSSSPSSATKLSETGQITGSAA